MSAAFLNENSPAAQKKNRQKFNVFFGKPPSDRVYKNPDFQIGAEQIGSFQALVCEKLENPKNGVDFDPKMS